MIQFLRTLSEHRPSAEIRAGGTDLMERLRRGLVGHEIDDLRDVPELDRIVAGSIGARVRLATLAGDPSVREGWPAVALAAGALATPQIRAVATVGGNLSQALRCAVYRDPGLRCMRRGGTGCPAREGDRQMLAIEDGPCIAVHPSTLACALLLYEGGVEADGALRPFEDWLASPAGAVSHVVLPAPEAGERGAYRRAIHRARAEWPLVEIAGRRVGDRVLLAAGGVGALPVRLSGVEAAIAAGTPEPWTRAGDGMRPHADTAFKLPLLRNLTRVVLEDLS